MGWCGGCVGLVGWRVGYRLDGGRFGLVEVGGVGWGWVRVGRRLEGIRGEGGRVRGV